MRSYKYEEQNGLRTSGVRSMDGWKKTEDDGPWASPRLRPLRHKLSIRWRQSSHVPTNHTGVTLGV